MSFGKKRPPEPQPEPTGIEEETISNTQEAVVIPTIIGERKVSGRWISRPYNMRAVPVPVERPGKK